MQKITIGKGHVVASGQTQYGKSYVIKNALFPYYPRAVFYDIKHDPGHADLRKKYKVVKSVKKIEEFFKKGGTHCIYQPPYLDYKQAVNHHDDICRYIFTTGNISLFNDEAAAITTPGQIGHWQYILMSQGLSRGCNVINVTQSPTMCHNVLLSQSDYFIVFRHNIKSHRDKLGGIIGEHIAEQLSTLPKYDFIFVQPDGEHFRGRL